MIPETEWIWYGMPGHFICAQDCRFHLCTQVGRVLVSTVGAYEPQEGAREILAQSRGQVLEGKGDARRYSWFKQNGWEEIGHKRTFETMVFARDGLKRCGTPECGCGVPSIIPSELDMEGYTDAGAATSGHLVLCQKWALASQQEQVNV